MNTMHSSRSCFHLRLVLLASERSAGKSMTTPFGEKQAVGGSGVADGCRWYEKGRVDAG